MESNPKTAHFLIERDQSGRFLNGHQKVGGRKKGSLNFNTRLTQNLMDTKGLEGWKRRMKIVETILTANLNIEAITGMSPNKRTMDYLFLFLDEPVGGIKNQSKFLKRT